MSNKRKTARPRMATEAARAGLPGREIDEGLASGELRHDTAGIGIYHEMRAREGFEETAGMLWVMVREAARQHPGKPRHLYLDIDGHRDRARGSGYDADATELISFARAALGPYLTRAPWGKAEDGPQREDMPDVMLIPTGDRMCVLTGDRDQPVRWETRETMPGGDGGA